MIKKIFNTFSDFGKQLTRDNIAAYASSTAFFFFLSIAPILLVLCSVVTFTPVTKEQLINSLVGFVTPSMHSTLTVFINQIYLKANRIIPVSLFVLLWSAGKGMMALQMGLNVVHGVVETRNFIVVRLQACFYTIITIVLLIVSLLLSSLGEILERLINKYLPKKMNLLGFFLRYRFFFIFIILIILFTLIFTFVPNIKLKLKYQVPGAIFTAVGWSAYSFLFSLYIENFDGMSTYGSLSTIVIVLFWLYFSMYLLLVGANLNRYFKPIIKAFFVKSRNVLDKLGE